MKKILIALTIAGLAHFSANAQGKFNENYKVCKYDNGYAICGANGTAQTQTSAHGCSTAPATVTIIVPVDDMTSTSSSVSMNTTNSYEGYYRHHNIMVSDEIRAPYEGLPSPQDDGPQRNDQRNLNYQSGLPLPASDGSMPR